MLASGEMSGRFGEVTVLTAGQRHRGASRGRARAGRPGRLDGFRLHNAYTLAGRELRRRRLTRPVLAADTSLAGTTPSRTWPRCCARW